MKYIITGEAGFIGLPQYIMDLMNYRFKIMKIKISNLLKIQRPANQCLDNYKIYNIFFAKGYMQMLYFKKYFLK